MLSRSPACPGAAGEGRGVGTLELCLGDVGTLCRGCWSCAWGMLEQVCISCCPSQGVNPAPEFTFLCDGRCDTAALASLLPVLPAGHPGVRSRGCSSALAGWGMAGPCPGGQRDPSRGWAGSRAQLQGCVLQPCPAVLQPASVVRVGWSPRTWGGWAVAEGGVAQRRVSMAGRVLKAGGEEMSWKELNILTSGSF